MTIATIALAATAQVEFQHKGLKYTTLDAVSVKVSKIDDDHLPKGKLVIPAQVTHKGTNYSVTTLDSWAFSGCEDVTEIVLPNTLTKIDIWALCGCKKLKEINIPSSVKEIGYAAFESCNSISSITLPNGLKEVPERVVKECENLRTVNLPASITTIGNSAFSYCKKLESITLPDNVARIEAYAFANCDNLKRIVMPKHLKSIASEAFGSCKSLTTIDLPEGMTSLSDKAFNYCEALEEVTLPSTLINISGNPFYSCKALKGYKVASGNKSFTVKDGILFSKDMTKLIACPPSLKIGNYTVPPTVKEILSGAFYYCTALTGIKMTAVEVIGEDAFNGCNNLATVDLGKKLKILEKAAFYSNAMKSITLPDGFEHMDMNNFDFCHELRTVSLSEALSKREKDFNNFSFNYNSEDLRFIVRLPKGKTKTLKFEEINDMKKYLFHDEVY